MLIIPWTLMARNKGKRTLPEAEDFNTVYTEGINMI
jgi:hypothetical protein